MVKMSLEKSVGIIKQVQCVPLRKAVGKGSFFLINRFLVVFSSVFFPCEGFVKLRRAKNLV